MTTEQIALLVDRITRLGFAILALFCTIGILMGKIDRGVIMLAIVVIMWTTLRIFREGFFALRELTQKKQ